MIRLLALPLLTFLFWLLPLGSQQRLQSQGQPPTSNSSTELSTQPETAGVADLGAPREELAPGINWMRSLNGERVTSLSDADLVAMIRRSIEIDQQELEALLAELEDENSPYARCEAAFQKISERQQALASALEEAQTESEQASLQVELDTVEPLLDLARSRFDLAIERQQLIRQMLPILRVLIAQAQRLQDQALGRTAVPVVDRQLDSESAQPSPDDSLNLTPASEPGSNGDNLDETPSEELDEAEANARRWETMLRAFEASVDMLEARISDTDQAVQLEQGLLENARRTVDNSRAVEELLAERLEQLSDSEANAEFLAELRAAADEAAEAATYCLERSRNAADRLTRLTEARGFVLEALTTRRQDAQLASQELVQARRQIARISNPFHPRNLFRWFLDHGPNILGILMGMVIAHIGVRFIGSRVVHMLARRGIRGSKEERHSRADTLVNSFRQFGNLSVILGGSLMILDEAGIPIVPLLGGAAVLGLAVAFGAQNLIQDFFQGFMILLENQYKLKDVVKIGEHAGLVEQITLRTTALRGLDGTLHFIPNGQIQAVSNLTHGWSRALLDVPVAYKEDPDRVMVVMREVCSEVRADLQFSPLILENAEVLGIEDFADSAIIIRLFIKTRPLQQWTVRREILRRLKYRFDREGIEIPFPHHSVYFRSSDGGALEQVLANKFSSSVDTNVVSD